MGRLFWKIFIWYWLTAVTLVVLAAWATHQVARVNQPDAVSGFTPSGARATLRIHRVVRRASAHLAAGDLEQAAGAIELMPKRLFILNEHGEDVGGRPLPRAVRAWRDGRGRAGWVMQGVRTPEGQRFTVLARLPRAEPSDTPVGETVGETTLPPVLDRPHADTAGESRPARPIADAARTGEEGLSGRRKRPNALRALLGPPRVREYWWVRLLVALAVSGVVCYLLTRYLLRPLRTLGQATRQVAAGDLQTRVGPALGRRRDEIVDLGHDFDRMAEQIASLVTSKERLLRDVAHELRSPLARLRVALELARVRSDGQADSEHDRIELEAERLGELIGQILTLEELTRPLERTAVSTVDLGELVREVCDDAAFETGASVNQDNDDARVVVHADIRREMQVVGDRRQLRSALENIVRNACKYSAAGGLVNVTLDVAADGGGAKIEVADQGPGVAPDALAHLFDPFYRTDDARTREQGGYGLGLAIAARITTRHAGRIHAANARPGPDASTGLVVTIELPDASAEKTKGVRS